MHGGVAISFPIKSATVKIETGSDTLFYQKLNVSGNFSDINMTVTVCGRGIGYITAIYIVDCCIITKQCMGELFLVGDASEMEYESALNSVIYVNTSDFVVKLGCVLIQLFLSSFISAEDIGGFPFDHVVMMFSVSDGTNAPGTARATYGGCDLRLHRVKDIFCV